MATKTGLTDFIFTPAKHQAQIKKTNCKLFEISPAD